MCAFRVLAEVIWWPLSSRQLHNPSIFCVLQEWILLYFTFESIDQRKIAGRRSSSIVRGKNEKKGTLLWRVYGKDLFLLHRKTDFIPSSTQDDDDGQEEEYLLATTRRRLRFWDEDHHDVVVTTTFQVHSSCCKWIKAYVTYSFTVTNNFVRFYAFYVSKNSSSSGAAARRRRRSCKVLWLTVKCVKCWLNKE